MKKITVSGEKLVFLGALFWSLNAPLIKLIEVDALLTCGLRAVIAGFFLLPFLRPKKLKITLWLPIHLFAHCGLCVCVVLALRLTSSVIAIGMQYSSIVWLFLADIVLTGKQNRKQGKAPLNKLNKDKLFPVILISIGVIIFMISGLEGSSMAGNLIAMTESVSFAALTVSAAKVSGGNPLGLTALANLFTGFFVFIFLSPQFIDILTLSRQEWTIMLVLGIVQVGAGYACYNMGVNKITAQKATVIALWEMILGPVWVALFLCEYPGILVCIGFLFIIAGIIMDAKG